MSKATSGWEAGFTPKIVLKYRLPFQSIFRLATGRRMWKATMVLVHVEGEQILNDANCVKRVQIHH